VADGESFGTPEQHQGIEQVIVGHPTAGKPAPQGLEGARKQWRQQPSTTVLSHGRLLGEWQRHTLVQFPEAEFGMHLVEPPALLRLPLQQPIKLPDAGHQVPRLDAQAPPLQLPGPTVRLGMVVGRQQRPQGRTEHTGAAGPQQSPGLAVTLARLPVGESYGHVDGTEGVVIADQVVGISHHAAVDRPSGPWLLKQQPAVAAAIDPPQAVDAGRGRPGPDARRQPRLAGRHGARHQVHPGRTAIAQLPPFPPVQPGHVFVGIEARPLGFIDAVAFAPHGAAAVAGHRVGAGIMQIGPIEPGDPLPGGVSKHGGRTMATHQCAVDKEEG